MGAIATSRFGLGARPGEIEAASKDATGWLLAQLQPSAAPAWIGLPHSAELLREARRLEIEQPVERLRRPWFETTIRSEHQHRATHMFNTPAPFRERWAMFWRNHFAVKIDAHRVELIAGAYAREAIDPHLFGRYEDMVLAAVSHPAMLFSLNQVASVGPNSRFGRATGAGLNENLARELMELHTLGVDGGYDQDDVAELAKVLTGWTVGGDDAGIMAGRFIEDPERREPGARRVLGRTWPESEDRARLLVRRLAGHPATARRVAVKLARHFTADAPPESLVKRLRVAFLESEGDLRVVAETLVNAPECWVAEPRKFKTPIEFVTSLHRATEAPDSAIDAALGAAMVMGHFWLTARSPDGWSDEASAWATPQGIALRAQYAWGAAHKSAAPDSRAFANTVLGRLVRRETAATAMSGAGLDRPSAFALVAMSPEFQRR